MTQRSGKPVGQRFTIEQLRVDRSGVVRAAKQQGGAIVVDNEGARRFTISIPQAPITDAD